MKIVMASHYFASHLGGVEIVARELFRALTRKGWEVVWMASDASVPPETLGGSHAVSLPVCNLAEERFGIPFPFPLPGALGAINREVKNSDVVILQDCLYLTNILAYVLARLHGIPTIIIQHTRFVPYRNYMLNCGIRLAYKMVAQCMLAHAAQVVFISETTRKFFGKLRFRNPPEVVFNGVDSGTYRMLTESESRLSLRHDFGLPEDRPVILFAGRFVETKGIAVMQRMAIARRDWTWALAGQGPLDPTSWNAANVQVFSTLRGPSMAALYRACDLLVLPSRGEGFPLVIQEALASGLPVLCGTETIGADRVLQTLASGAAVFPDDDDRTAQEFLSVVDHMIAHGTNEKCQERRDLVVSRYSWDGAAERYVEIILRVIAQAALPSLYTRRTPENEAR